MTHIKSWVMVAACALALPAFSAETDTLKAADKAKAEARKTANVKGDKVAGQVSAPAVTTESVDKSANDAKAATPFTLKDSRWVPKEDRS